MPILLSVPSVTPAVHGESASSYTMVAIVAFSVHVLKRQVVLTLQYGDVVDDAWVSKAESFRLRISDVPAVVVDGQDENGAWVSEEVTPADPKFVDMRAAFQITEDDVGQLGYDVTSAFLYAYLLSNGYYQGTIL